MISEELEDAYASSVASHNEAEGDDALLFGNTVRVRHRHRAAFRCEEKPGVVLEETAWRVHRVRVGRFRIKIYKLGEFIDDDIYRCLPNRGGDVERLGGLIRLGQIPLFSVDPVAPLEIHEAVQINDLVYGHFGNPRQGLVKQYAGAVVLDERGRQRWAWVLRQDERTSSALADGDLRPKPIVPFSQRQPAAIEVKAKGAMTEYPEVHQVRDE